MGGKGGDKYTV